MTGTSRLYTPELLALTLRLAAWPWSDDLVLGGEARSRTCGSQVKLGLGLDADGRIAALGLRVQACAVGQAAAALFAEAAVGMDAQSILAAHTAMVRWIAGEASMPDWPGLGVIAPALATPARHGAMLLAWQAATAALSSAARND